jgi:hypothetical protein
VKFKLSNPWLKNVYFDLCLFLIPPFFALGLAFYFNIQGMVNSDLPEWAWLLFILGIDVTHVYSTLFRSYFNQKDFQEHKNLMTLIPIVIWIVGIVLYAIGALVFWRVLAYLAVFHFIRQQYGFLRLYCRSEKLTHRDFRIDQMIIYTVTLYPIIYWHTEMPRAFHWFMDGDFFSGLPLLFRKLGFVFYILAIGMYLVNEVLKTKRGVSLNIPKNLLVLGTGLTWYFGIIYFNNDLIFTMTNVVAHGIPYIALIWLYGERQAKVTPEASFLSRFGYRLFFSKFSAPLFFGVLFLLSYLEEGLWAALVWREHLELFKPFVGFSQISSSESLTLIVPLLSVPQVTHYVLDGFIWKLRQKNAHWNKILY